MKIVHLSDIHLSYSNYLEFQNHYKDALIDDLRQYLPFDIIVITGDLVDRGGDSLYEIPKYKGTEDKLSPFDIFQEVFIEPICEALQFSRKCILFIPGNHDVDEKNIGLHEESKLIKELNDDNIAIKLQENLINYTHSTRIKRFKEFEEKYHVDTDNYIFSENQSTYIHEDSDGLKIGFLLINDSWRCKSVKLFGESEDEKHYVGEQQFYDGLKYLKSQGTQVNICLLHHDLDNYKDQKEIEGLIIRDDFEVVLFGHYHSQNFISPYYLGGKYIKLRCRASFNKPSEVNSSYKPGYQILEIKNNVLTSIHYRVYNNNPEFKKFHPDSENAPPHGINSNTDNLGFKFQRKVSSYNNLDKNNFK